MGAAVLWNNLIAGEMIRKKEMIKDMSDKYRKSMTKMTML
jgi:hypothetical protein